ncbi:hypothetical protein ALP72_02247 [Pseudomonas coronafaciens pv. coronafaciens]|uniref:hypothetical protein n=1 Tax=Pseudomonas coronafaciens TaxID=53409 RepID=UPI000EFEDBED|nr:hypothetical protein [Pseudomonas coronafaciens]RMS11893.1 hypothetical protein ALP72_02247 [Pseudomonas coronafaciens pv. coronafaciens]
MASTYISHNTKTKERLADLALESTNAYVLLIFLMIESDDFYGKHQVTYQNYDSMAQYLGKSKETVRVALNILRKRKLISEEYHGKTRSFLIEVLVNKI